MENTWDVIVVGARCAGATLATHLARAGKRVLLLDGAARGSNMPMSTHYVQPPGMAALERLGLRDKVREVTPPTRTFRMALDDTEAFFQTPSEMHAYCVRRSTIDPLLQDVAEQAGATFLDRHMVVDLLREGERVVGVVARSDKGNVEFRANLVVGADGARSKVAELTSAKDYMVHVSDRGGYFSYYPAPEVWTEPWDGSLEHLGDGLRYVFRCDDGLLCVVYVGPAEEVEGWTENKKQHLHDALMQSPTTRALVKDHAPRKVTGLLRPRFFYREPVGPGYALIGDAGHFKDFVTGHGMADAFLDAERMVPAILDGSEAAFEAYWRRRDAETLPLHMDAIRQGAVGYNSPFTRAAIAELGGDPELGQRVTRMFNREITPQEMVPGKTLLKIIGKALLRGRFDVVKDFLQQGKRLGAEGQTMKEAVRKAQASMPLQQVPLAAPRPPVAAA